jgi:hypothetical protein
LEELSERYIVFLEDHGKRIGDDLGQFIEVLGDEESFTASDPSWLWSTIFHPE